MSGTLDTSDEDSDDALRTESDWLAPEEAVGQRPRVSGPIKIRRYGPHDPELKEQRIHVLPSNDTTTLPDGNIIDYQLVNPALERIKWGFLVVDEAHMARRLDGVFNIRGNHII